MRGIEDTIAAIATAPGAAGLAVVRVSGPRALAVADAVFRGRSPLALAPSHTLHHGWAEWPEAPAGDGANGVGGTPADDSGAGPVTGRSLRDARPRARGRVDEVVAALFRAPRSYTREDVVELSCHGGGGATLLLEALVAAGARPARAGEFTLRAFLNGRLDLAQAEAVADVIHAESRDARSLALGQLAGELSRRLAAVRAPLEDLLAEVEARVDFAEDVGGIEIPPHAVAGIEAADAALGDLLAGAAFGRAMREGVRVPLVGSPNAGKSSLFNALVGEERALVAAEPGTTRDRVSEPVEVAGVRVVLSDTAGLREGGGEVEAMGVARARDLLDGSPRVVWVVDGSRPLGAAEREIAARLAAGATLGPVPAGTPAVGSDGAARRLEPAADPGGAPANGAAAASGPGFAERRVLVALNKRDRAHVVRESDVLELLAGSPAEAVAVSAVTGEGLGPLREALGRLAGAGSDAGVAAVSNARHVEALGRARASLARAAREARAGSPGEIVALELRECLAAIGEVTGQSVAEDLLDRIFARFCVGK